MAVKCFVGSLPSGIDEGTFASLFEQFGTIVSTVCNPEKRYGFVTFSSEEEAQQAIQSVNGHDLNGSNVVVKLAANQGVGGGGGHPRPPAVAALPAAVRPSNGAVAPQTGDRLYVKGLPSGMTDDAVRTIFEVYGTIQDTKVLVANGKSDDGQGQSVAIVKFANAAEAAWLVDNVNGNIPQGLSAPVLITYAGQRSGPAAAAAPAYQRYSPYPSAPKTTSLGMAIPALPPPVYPVGAAMAPQVAAPAPVVWQPPPPRQTGGGPGSDALVPHIKEMMAQSGPNSALYVKGLPLNADDLYLYKVFSPFGCVLSAKALAKDSYCIGFVYYASEDMARNAMDGLHGQPLTDGTVLQVAIKTARG